MDSINNKHLNVELVQLGTPTKVTGNTYLDNYLTLDQMLEELNRKGLFGRIGFPPAPADMRDFEYLSIPVDPKEASHYISNLRVDRSDERKAIVGDVQFIDPIAERLFTAGIAAFGMRSQCLVNGVNKDSKEERLISKIVSFDLVDATRDRQPSLVKDFKLVELGVQDEDGDILVNSGVVLQETLDGINKEGPLSITINVDRSVYGAVLKDFRVFMEGSRSWIICDIEYSGNYIKALVEEGLVKIFPVLSLLSSFRRRGGSPNYVAIKTILGLRYELGTQLK